MSARWVMFPSSRVSISSRATRMSHVFFKGHVSISSRTREWHMSPRWVMFPLSRVPISSRVIRVSHVSIKGHVSFSSRVTKKTQFSMLSHKNDARCATVQSSLLEIKWFSWGVSSNEKRKERKKDRKTIEPRHLRYTTDLKPLIWNCTPDLSPLSSNRILKWF